MDASVADEAFALVQRLRDADVAAVCDTQGRSLKSQFKVAGKSGAACVVVVGPDELAQGEVTLRDMATHGQSRVALDGLADAVKALFG